MFNYLIQSLISQLLGAIGWPVLLLALGGGSVWAAWKLKFKSMTFAFVLFGIGVVGLFMLMAPSHSRLQSERELAAQRAKAHAEAAASKEQERIEALATVLAAKLAKEKEDAKEVVTIVQTPAPVATTPALQPAATIQAATVTVQLPPLPPIPVEPDEPEKPTPPIKKRYPFRGDGWNFGGQGEQAYRDACLKIDRDFAAAQKKYRADMAAYPAKLAEHKRQMAVYQSQMDAYQAAVQQREAAIQAQSAPPVPAPPQPDAAPSEMPPSPAPAKTAVLQKRALGSKAPLQHIPTTDEDRRKKAEDDAWLKKKLGPSKEDIGRFAEEKKLRRERELAAAASIGLKLPPKETWPSDPWWHHRKEYSDYQVALARITPKYVPPSRIQVQIAHGITPSSNDLLSRPYGPMPVKDKALAKKAEAEHQRVELARRKLEKTFKRPDDVNKPGERFIVTLPPEARGTSIATGKHDGRFWVQWIPGKGWTYQAVPPEQTEWQKQIAEGVNARVKQQAELIGK